MTDAPHDRLWHRLLAALNECNALPAEIGNGTPLEIARVADERLRTNLAVPFVEGYYLERRYGGMSSRLTEAKAEALILNIEARSRTFQFQRQEVDAPASDILPSSSNVAGEGEKPAVSEPMLGESQAWGTEYVDEIRPASLPTQDVEEAERKRLEEDARRKEAEELNRKIEEERSLRKREEEERKLQEAEAERERVKQLHRKAEHEKMQREKEERHRAEAEARRAAEASTLKNRAKISATYNGYGRRPQEARPAKESFEQRLTFKDKAAIAFYIVGMFGFVMGFIILAEAFIAPFVVTKILTVIEGKALAERAFRYDPNDWNFFGASLLLGLFFLPLGLLLMGTKRKTLQRLVANWRPK